MAEMPTKACSSCGALMIMARTGTGVMPMNERPEAAGSYELTAVVGGAPTARHIPPAQRAGRADLHVTHFATCPYASTHRRGPRLR